MVIKIVSNVWVPTLTALYDLAYSSQLSYETGTFIHSIRREKWDTERLTNLLHVKKTW